MDIASLKRLLGSLSSLVDEISQHLKSAIHDKDWERFDARFERWQTTCANILNRSLGEDEAGEFRYAGVKKSISVTASKADRYTFKTRQFLHHLEALLENIKKHPEEYLRSPGEQFLDLQTEKGPLSGKQVFIVHGHDGASLGQLSDLLKDEFGLEPIILKKKAGRSRHILLKFEQEAKKAAFALVLLTPDDLVKTEKGEFAQARPNAIFELGWFFRHLSHERVRIIMRKGTNIHSDLAGIERLEFHDDVDEIFAKLKRELVASGYDPVKKEFVR